MRSMDDYERIGQAADEATERILRKASAQPTKGNTIAVNYATLYEKVFPVILQDMLSQEK